jgi:hypothetical protein
VDAGQLDVLHHAGTKASVAVGDGVGLGLDGVLQERSIRIGRSGVTSTAAAT